MINGQLQIIKVKKLYANILIVMYVKDLRGTPILAAFRLFAPFVVSN